jgi:hypothetical protein
MTDNAETAMDDSPPALGRHPLIWQALSNGPGLFTRNTGIMTEGPRLLTHYVESGIVK